MRILSPFFLLLLFACQSPTEKQAFPFSDGEWIDLSYTFDDQTVYWPTAEGFHFDTVFAGHTEGGYYYSAFQFCSAEHGGTHMDAPIHFSEGRLPVDQVPLSSLIGEAAVVDVSEKALADRDYLVSIEDLQAWEQMQGRELRDLILIVRTGYGRYWPDRVQYMGTDERGPEAVPKLHFPGLDPAAATWLVQNRSIKAFGLDTPSLDYGQSKDFKTHQILNGANIPGMENLANLDQLPAVGAYVVALPMKIAGGSGGPLRAVAWVEK